jgi:hypothetical protein
VLLDSWTGEEVPLMKEWSHTVRYPSTTPSYNQVTGVPSRPRLTQNRKFVKRNEGKFASACLFIFSQSEEVESRLRLGTDVNPDVLCLFKVCADVCTLRRGRLRGRRYEVKWLV